MRPQGPRSRGVARAGRNPAPRRGTGRALLAFAFASGAVLAFAGCGSFGNSAASETDALAPSAAPEGGPGPAPAEAGPDAAGDASPADAAPVASYLGTATAVQLPVPAIAYAESGGRIFVFLPGKSQDQAIALVVGGVPTSTWRSDSPALGFAMLATASTESEVVDGLAALALQSSKRLKVGTGHAGDSLFGAAVASAGGFAYLAMETEVRELSIDARLNITASRPVCPATVIETPFAVRADRLALLRREGAALRYHTRPDTTSAFGVGELKTLAPLPEGFQVLSVYAGGFSAAGRCAPNLSTMCVWKYVGG